MREANLTDQFAIPDVLRFDETPGGLVRALVSTPAADAEIYLHGAHVTGWTPCDLRPVLFVSSQSLFEPGKAIRGGVPIVFPWFGPRGDGKPGPPHGFARIREWTVEGAKLRSDGKVEITLALTPDDATGAFGYGSFHLRFRVTIGDDLEMELETRNLGPEPLIFEEALHTYFAVGDIHRVSVSGLAGTTYIDKTDGFKRKTLGSGPLRIAKETDQVHVNTQAACLIDDPAWDRRIIVEKSGSGTTVVWNPWIDKTRSMSDMAPGDWQETICVETANAADNSVHLSPGVSHKLKASIRVEYVE